MFAAFTLAAAAAGVVDCALLGIVFAAAAAAFAVTTIGAGITFGAAVEVIVEIEFDELLATTIADDAGIELELMMGLICVLPTLIGAWATMLAAVGTLPGAVCLMVAGAACRRVTDRPPIVAPDARICKINPQVRSVADASRVRSLT